MPPPRPGLIAAARRAIATRVTRAGAVVTREGCALGVVPATGAIAELRWAETARGALVVGAVAQDVALAGLQVVHAALRLRKPVIVFDPGGDAVIARALAAACRATGTPLLTAGSPGVPAASGLWGRGTGRERPPEDPPDNPVSVDLGRVGARARGGDAPGGFPGARRPGLRRARGGSPADLRRIGVDGDALVWAPRGELLTAQALGELLRDGQAAGLAVLIGATAPAAAAELSALAGTALIQPGRRPGTGRHPRRADRHVAAARGRPPASARLPGRDPRHPRQAIPGTPAPPSPPRPRRTWWPAR